VGSHFKHVDRQAFVFWRRKILVPNSASGFARANTQPDNCFCFTGLRETKEMSFYSSKELFVQKPPSFDKSMPAKSLKYAR